MKVNKRFVPSVKSLAMRPAGAAAVTVAALVTAAMSQLGVQATQSGRMVPREQPREAPAEPWRNEPKLKVNGVRGPQANRKKPANRKVKRGKNGYQR